MVYHGKPGKSFKRGNVRVERTSPNKSLLLSQHRVPLPPGTYVSVTRKRPLGFPVAKSRDKISALTLRRCKDICGVRNLNRIRGVTPFLQRISGFYSYFALAEHSVLSIAEAKSIIKGELARCTGQSKKIFSRMFNDALDSLDRIKRKENKVVFDSDIWAACLSVEMLNLLEHLEKNGADVKMFSRFTNELRSVLPTPPFRDSALREIVSKHDLFSASRASEHFFHN